MSATPLTVIIGEPWTISLARQSPSGAAIDTTGMGLDCAMTWQSQSSPLVPAISRTDSTGTAQLSLMNPDTANVPVGQLSTLRVRYTDLSGQTDTFDFPIIGIKP